MCLLGFNYAIAQTSFNISNQTTGDTLFTIDNNGRVGIGTTTPGASIDVNSSAVETASSIRLGNLDNSRFFRIYSGNASYSPMIRWHEGAALRFAAWTDTYTELMRLTAEGNLGIGTTDPTAKFTISGSSGSLNHGESAVFLQNSNRYFDFNGGMIFRGSGMNWNSRFTATDDLGAEGEVVGIYKHEATAGDVLNDVTEVIAIFKNNGHVGIGLSDPDQGLVVADTIRSTVGGFQFPDGTVQETAATGSGGNTLDEAYNQGGAGVGRDITADNGSVRIFGNDGLYVQGDINTSGSVHSGGSLFLYGSGNEGGQLSLRDGDDDGGWIIDNYGNSNTESFRIFNPDGTTPVFNALVIGDTGNVGIGIGGPEYPLDVDGIIQSRSGGFRFPDGSVQGTAAIAGVFSIDSLSDARTLGNSVYLGEGSGILDDGSDNNNTAVGMDALHSNTNGYNNTAVGYLSLNTNATGDANTALGRSALFSNITGNYNTGLGLSALFHNTTGLNNVAIGNSANFRNQEGSENTIVGVQAGYGATLHNKSGNVFLGFNAGYSETGDNKLYIENSNSTTPLIWGDFAEDSLRINGDLHVTGNIYSDGPGGGTGNTLDQAYDEGGAGAGRIITADAGAFTIAGIDGFLSTGTFGSGAIPVEGAGTRMIWYPGKAAFRAGQVTGTQWNDTYIGNYSTAWGYDTRAFGDYSTAMGSGTISSGSSAVAMGVESSASGARSVAMGFHTTASGAQSVAMGTSTTASGIYSLATGYHTEAEGNYSTVMGSNVSTSGEGSFILGDHSGSTTHNFIGDNGFIARFAGGYILWTDDDASVGVTLNPGGYSWTIISDSTKKENFQSVNGEEILNKISKLLLSSWNLKGQSMTRRHYGPMAQDFYAAFGNDGIGIIGNDTTIASADFDGVNLIAIQALEKRTSKNKKETNNLKKELELLTVKNHELDEKVSDLKNDKVALTHKLQTLEQRLQNFEKKLAQFQLSEKVFSVNNNPDN